MSDYQKQKTLTSIKECKRFIEREEIRLPSLRPTEVQNLLNFYRQHLVTLTEKLESYE